MKIVKRILALSLLAGSITSGCSVLDGEGRWFANKPDDSAIVKDDLGVIAQNLVFAMAQVDGLSPLQTTVQMIPARTEFGEVVHQCLRDAGYGVQMTEGDRGSNVVQYRISQEESELGHTTRYRLQIGAVATEREYLKVEGHLVPQSDMRLEGTPADGIALNDEIFKEGNPHVFSSLVVSDIDTAPVVRDLEEIDAILATARDTSGARRDAMRLPAIPPVATADRSFYRSIQENLANRDVSNFDDLFAEYEDLTRDVLVFPRGNIDHLGPENKATLRRLLDRFNERTDLISLIGCSNGRTQIPGGNEHIALSRAERVKNELVYLGVDPKSVMSEACWASNYNDRQWPSRGVVITHKRVQL